MGSTRTPSGGPRVRAGMGRLYLDANAEALRRGDRKVGTEHLVLALLLASDPAAAFALGVGLGAAREALEGLDRDALAAIGVEAAPAGPVVPGRERDRLPLTPAAKAVLMGLGGQARREGGGSALVLRALLSRARPDPAAVLFDALGVDRAGVLARLGRG